MLQYNQRYIDSLVKNGKKFPYWEKLNNKSILITGGTGLVCSYLVDMIMLMNEVQHFNIRLILTGRNEMKAIERFEKWFYGGNMEFVKQDISEPLQITTPVEYVIHAASNAYPAVYDKDPVGTMKANYIGTNNLLEYSVRSQVENFLFISSGEIYGEREITEGVKEDFQGHIDHLDPRSCYPISKIASETLCASYSKQYGVHTNIARLCHVYGPTMTKSDNRVINQFLRNVLGNEDIVMKSTGSKVRSYCYVADAVIGILYILLEGENGKAYNVSYEDSVMSIKEIAETIANFRNKQVVMDCNEEAGGTKIEKSILDGSRLKNLGWSGTYNMETGMKECYDILLNEVET